MGLTGGLDPLWDKWSVSITDHLKKKKNFESGSNPRPTFQPKTDIQIQIYRLMVITLSVWYTALRATTRLKTAKISKFENKRKKIKAENKTKSEFEGAQVVCSCFEVKLSKWVDKHQNWSELGEIWCWRCEKINQKMYGWFWWWEWSWER